MTMAGFDIVKNFAACAVKNAVAFFENFGIIFIAFIINLFY